MKTPTASISPTRSTFLAAKLTRANAAGSYSVFAVNGYTLPKTPVSVKKKKEDRSVEIVTYAPGVPPPFSIDRDVEDFVITLNPENKASQ